MDSGIEVWRLVRLPSRHQDDPGIHEGSARIASSAPSNVSLTAWSRPAWGHMETTVTSESTGTASARFTELLVALIEELRSRLVTWTPRDEQLLFVAGLQPVSQHRSVDLLEDVRTDLDLQVGPDAEDVPVERRMVDLAERESVGDDRLTSGVAIRQDVGGVE